MLSTTILRGVLKVIINFLKMGLTFMQINPKKCSFAQKYYQANFKNMVEMLSAN